MVTADSVKAKLQSLIDLANGATGGTDADLATAIATLIAGFGSGDTEVLKKLIERTMVLLSNFNGNDNRDYLVDACIPYAIEE